ncbi:MAG: TetR family transcriptional regulator [Acidimicrobiales bacterium]
MAVNGDPGHRRTQAERSAATRGALLAAARDLFAERGYARTAREEIVERAGVTRGALYHHFADKADLFRAVYLELEQEVSATIARAARRGTDPRDQFRLGALAFLDAASDAAYRRVVLLDAPAVLSVEVRRDISETHGLGLVRRGLKAVMDAGLIEQQPLEPLAHLLLAALHEAARLVADATDPAAARAEVGATVERLLAGL